MIDEYHIITVENAPHGFMYTKIQGEKDGLPKGSIETTIGKFLTGYSKFRSIERTEQKGKYHVVISSDGTKHIDYKKSVRKMIENIGNNTNHQATIAAMKEFNAPIKIKAANSTNFLELEIWENLQ